MYSGVKGSWINFILISEVTYATQCLLLADSASTVFFSILNHSAVYSNTSKITASSYPEKQSRRISCYSLLKYKLFTISDSQIFRIQIKVGSLYGNILLRNIVSLFWAYGDRQTTILNVSRNVVTSISIYMAWSLNYCGWSY